MKGEIIVSKVGQHKEGFESIRIDRKTIFGNPFFMTNESYRDTVCDRFAKYFEDSVSKPKSELRKELIKVFIKVREGENINLQCHCAPKRCHGDEIKKFIERHL